MSNYPPPGNGGPPPVDGDRPPPRRSRSRSPPGRRRGNRRGDHRSQSRSRSYSRSRSPPPLSRRRSRSPPRRRRGRSRSRSWSGSRSRSPPRGGRFDRDRDYRGGGGGGGPRDRGPPPGPGFGPNDDFRGDFRGDYGRGGYGGYRDDYGPPRGPPPPFEPYNDRHGPGGPYGGPGRGGPLPRRGERRRRDEGPPGVSLLVRNVSPDITTQDLQMAFGRIGEVRDVYIPRDFHSQQPKGFAFIEYATPEMAREARDEMDRFNIKGRELEVVFAQERRKTPNEMRGRAVTSHNRRAGSFERSSSFERHRQRKRDEDRSQDRDRDRIHDDGYGERHDGGKESEPTRQENGRNSGGHYDGNGNENG